MSDSDIVFTSLDEAELKLWFSHTAECFAWKGTPKAHFENHFFLDPFRSVEDILVAKVAATIVSSVRIFAREMYIDGQVVKIGGIGEVCTQDLYKGKGFCKKLLLEAICRMRDHDFHFAALHCSKELIPVYRSVGFVSAPMRFINRTFKRGNYSDSGQTVHAFDHQNENLLAQLMQMHVHSSLRFNGCICRHNRDYWAYLSYNLQGGGFWLEKRSCNNSSSGSIETAAESDTGGSSTPVAAFVGLRRAKTGNDFVLVDFIADASALSADGGGAYLNLLVGHALRAYGEERASVRIPAAVAAAMPPPVRDSAEADRGEKEEEEEEEEEEDAGFMYLPLSDTDSEVRDEAAAAAAGLATPAGLATAAAAADPAAASAARAAAVEQRFGPERHVFWPADGF